MANATRDEETGGVVFIREEDGRVTARGLATGLARGGDTRAEALSQLAEVLVRHEGSGEPITDDDLEEMGLDSEDADDEDLPDVLK